MRVLVAGASGALGIPVVADALDRDDLLRAVNGFTADAVIHQLAWQPRFTTYREGIAAMVSDLCRE